MNGFLVVDKPPGKTSHDVVAMCRKRLGVGRIGHAGTLDPDATGVLVLGIGRATRLLQFLAGDDKEYVALAAFGVETSTQDASGDVVAEADASALTRGVLDALLPRFTGEIEQTPPMVSAVKVGGERLYRKALRGEDVERQPRRIAVHSLVCESFEPGPRARARLRVSCSKGTFVRTLVHDLGRAAGIGAHVAELRRTASGAFRLADAIGVEEVSVASVRAMEEAVASYPSIRVDEAGARALVQGKTLPAAGIDGPYAVLGPAGLVAMAQDRDAVARSLCVVASL